MNWKAIFIGITCEITFNLLGIDELICNLKDKTALMES